MVITEFVSLPTTSSSGLSLSTSASHVTPTTSTHDDDPSDGDDAAHAATAFGSTKAHVEAGVELAE